MNLNNERRLCARATALGESAESLAFAELSLLTQNESPRVRRLAASAIGKLAGIVSAPEAVRALLPLLQDTHPQVRQYTAKALSGFGTHAESALPDLRDLYRRPTEKDYVKRSVLRAGQTIREAMRLRDETAIHLCQRCGVRLDSDEYARSIRAFERPFCDPCFDAVFLERRNFDTRVGLQKTIQARDGTVVQSDGERRIAEILSVENIAYRYDERFRILDGYAIRPDFYLPEFDVYVEYWGMDTSEYKIGMLKKQQLYQQEGKRLISLYPADKPRLREVLLSKLKKYSS